MSAHWIHRKRLLFEWTPSQSLGRSSKTDGMLIPSYSLLPSHLPLRRRLLELLPTLSPSQLQELYALLGRPCSSLEALPLNPSSSMETPSENLPSSNSPPTHSPKEDSEEQELLEKLQKLKQEKEKIFLSIALKGAEAQKKAKDVRQEPMDSAESSPQHLPPEDKSSFRGESLSSTMSNLSRPLSHNMYDPSLGSRSGGGPSRPSLYSPRPVTYTPSSSAPYVRPSYSSERGRGSYTTARSYYNRPHSSSFRGASHSTPRGPSSRSTPY
jgi:hypothetical protein